MAYKKKKSTIDSLLASTREIFKKDQNIIGIPSIIDFCYKNEYLGLKSQGIKLHVAQSLVLRAFYKGSVGNTSKECLEMTPEEIAFCEENGLNGAQNGNILGKWKSDEIFSEMVLVWGRRSGKNYITSIIALYEAMKLLEAPGGDPYKIYKLGSAAPFIILTIANSEPQAKILYKEISSKLLTSSYFKDKFLIDGITQGKIYLLTPQDKIENQKLVASGLKPNFGSVLIEAGHSNSNSLVGKGCYTLLLDEAGLYKKTGGPGSDEQLYGSLSPTVRTYVRKEKYINKNGKEDERIVYDGKIISISSPRGMEGVFYNLYSNAEEVPQRLMCRLPTWKVNLTHTEQSLRNIENNMTEEKFRMEYGAEFSGTAGESFFSLPFVEKCFEDHPYSFKEFGQRGITYFAHLDPAVSNHNYALCIVHKENKLNKEQKRTDTYFVVDHIKIWAPAPGKPVLIDEVDQYMIDLHRKFYFGLVSYDNWQSQSSIEKLKRFGIPAICTRYSKYYKMKIYDHLEQLVNNEKIKIPYNKLMKDEMVNLQRRYMNNGYRVYPKRDGECRTDDYMDCLAGACYIARQTEYNKLPRSQIVNTGTAGGTNQYNHNWQTMQGGNFQPRKFEN
jgi:hypothetical protein